MRWISVKDKLPKLDTEVLIYAYYLPYESTRYKYHYAISLVTLFEDKPQWQYEINMHAKNGTIEINKEKAAVTYWAELPPVPTDLPVYRGAG